MEKEKEIFIPDKDVYKPYRVGEFKYKKCPVCKKDREFPDEFILEGFCRFCADNIFTEPDFFDRYLKAINKNYIQPILYAHAHFFSNN